MTRNKLELLIALAALIALAGLVLALVGLAAG
jgi:hypothetical protein